MPKGLEKILKKFSREIITLGLASSLFFGCAKESPISPIENPPPSPQNNPPIILSAPLTSVNENENYNYQVQASDPDGDNLKYFLIKKPSWLSISNSGLISGTSPEVSSNQSNEIEISVSDGKSSASQKYNLVVKNLYDVYVLNDNQINNLSAVNENSLVFSQPINFKAGDIVASGINDKTPYGILKEITSISSDQRTVYTSQATLEQVVKDASFSYSGRLQPPPGGFSSSIEGIEAIPQNIQGFDFNINLNNVVLYDHDGNENTKFDQLIANGNISFNTDVIFDIKINNHRINELTFKNITNIDTDVAVGFNALGVAQLYQIKIAEYNFQPFVAGYLPTLIPVPIIILPKLGVYVELDPTFLNPLSVRVQQDASADVGLYYNGFWDISSNFSNQFTFSNPVINGNLELKVHAGPNLEFLLYGVAGPFAAARGRLRLKHENERWELYGGFGASLGVKMEVLKKGVSLQFREIINYEKLLAESGVTPPPPTGDMLFVTTRDGNAEIYIMNSDGFGQQNLTNSFSHDYEPAWFPDKSKFVFVSERDGNPEIYTMNLDGSNLKRLTNNSAVDRMPDWSPNGQEIVFYSNRNGNDEIFLMNADGTNQRKLNLPFGIHGQPKWCGNSNQIVFSSTLSSGNFDIHKVNRDGTGLKQLTTSTAVDVEPSCSPDGTKIAFSSNRTNNYYDIWTMDIEGNNQTNLSNTIIGTDDYLSSWSSDGSMIAYTFGNINRSSSDIWKMSTDGSNKTRITTRAPGSSNVNPVWK